MLAEITSSRFNPQVDPGLHVWGWEIPVYLFLGGLVAGMMVLTGFFLLTGRHRNPRCASHRLPGLGIVLLSAGMLALFLDLEHKWFVWRLYTTFRPASPMSWGAWILILVYPVLAASLLLGLPPELGERVPRLAAVVRRAEELRARPALVRAVAVAGIALGSLLGIYTGILLSALGARPLWSSALLGPLFLVSGLSSAAAFSHLVAGDPEEQDLLARADNGFLAAELALLGLFLIGLLSSTRVHAAAARLLLGGPYTAVFWVFVVGLGAAVPLFLQAQVVRHRLHHSPVIPALVIAGGLALRFVFVYAGQLSQWSPV